MKDINKIKAEFERIKSMGFIESIADYEFTDRNDGAVGETFQYHLGRVARDNKKEADWEGWEIKTKRNMTKSWMTLFTIAPTFPEFGDKLMLKKWGKPDKIFPDLLSLYTSIYANRYAKVHLRSPETPTLLMKIVNDKHNRKIYLEVCDKNGNLLNDSVYWSYEDLKHRFLMKLKNTFVVDAEVKKIDGKDHFYYYSGTVLLESKFESFLDCIDKGYVRYEHANGPDHRGPKAGQPHNHGGKFRITKENSMYLASEIIVLGSENLDPTTEHKTTKVLEKLKNLICA